MYGPVGPRYNAELLQRLDQVFTTGHTEVRNAEFLLWYGKSRFMVTIWRDVSEKWDARGYKDGSDRRVPLLVGGADNVWVLVWGEGLTDSKESWLQDIRRYAKLGHEVEVEIEEETEDEFA